MPTDPPEPMERFEVDDSFQGLAPTGPPTQASVVSSATLQGAQSRFSDSPFQLSAFYPYLGRIATFITYPLTITLSLVANLAQFVFRLLRIPFPRISTGSLRFNFFGSSPRIARRPPRASNPAEAAQRWIMELEDETGAMSIGKATIAAAEGSSVEISDPNQLRRRGAAEGKGHLLPNFWLGSYESALKEAQSEPKVLCAIIVSEEHDDTMDFKRLVFGWISIDKQLIVDLRNVLTDPDFVRVLTDNDFLVWGGDVRDSDAYQGAIMAPEKSSHAKKYLYSCSKVVRYYVSIRGIHRTSSASGSSSHTIRTTSAKRNISARRLAIHSNFSNYSARPH